MLFRRCASSARQSQHMQNTAIPFLQWLHDWVKVLYPDCTYIGYQKRIRPPIITRAIDGKIPSTFFPLSVPQSLFVGHNYSTGSLLQHSRANQLHAWGGPISHSKHGISWHESTRPHRELVEYRVRGFIISLISVDITPNQSIGTTTSTSRWLRYMYCTRNLLEEEQRKNTKQLKEETAHTNNWLAICIVWH